MFYLFSSALFATSIFTGNFWFAAAGGVWLTMALMDDGEQQEE